MTIERWDPFREMISLRDAMNSLLAESFVRPGGPPAPGGAATLPLDVAETEGEFVIKASLPGIKPEDVQITVHGDTLTIRGESKAEEEKKGTHWHMRERRVSSFVRSLSLGTPINADAASAHFDHGVLTLTLPKTAEAKPKQIKVASGPTPPPSSDRPDRPAQERAMSGTGKHRPRPSAAEAGREARADPRRRRRASPRGARGRDGSQRRGVEPGADGGHRPGQPAGGAARPVIPASENRMHDERSRMIRDRAITGELIMSKHAKHARTNTGWQQAQASTPGRRIEAAPLRPSGGPGDPNAMDEDIPAIHVAEANGPMLSHEQVANRAYELWEAQGKPEGADRKNWYEAERQLRAKPE